MAIEMMPLNSSNIAAAGYDPEIGTLRIEFKSGAVYSYANVPAEVHADLMTAPSAGGYFFRNIKDRFATTKET